MSFTRSLRAIAAMTFVSTIVNAAPQGLIVGGKEAAEGEFPFIVSLQSNGRHFCGGSLVARNWVVTAAHCVKAVSKFKVVTGTRDLNDLSKAETFNIKRAIAHPKYNNSTTDYDYAVVELDGFSSAKTIDLNNTELQMDGQSHLVAEVAGWGTTGEGGGLLPTNLLKVEAPLVTQEACNKSYAGKITDRMLCGGFPEGGKDSCQGDSGGPLVLEMPNHTHALVGIVSWGKGCARPNYYGVYSKVSAGYEWIQSQIQQ